MIINLFTKQEVAHDTDKVHKAMTKNKKLNITVNFESVLDGIKSVEDKKYVVEYIATQLFTAAMAQFEDKDTLKDVAQNFVNSLNAIYKERLGVLDGEAKAETPVVRITSSVETTDEKKTEKKAKNKKETTETAKSEKTEKKAKEEVKQVLISQLTAAQIKKLGIKFQQYSEKSVFLSGDTRCIKEQIKKVGNGHWNHSRQGWFLKNDEGHTLAKAMGQRVYKMTANA